MAGDDVVSKATRLIEKYPNTYSDFYGSGTPCVYKSGPGHQQKCTFVTIGYIAL
ncbi:hypothetical protein BKA93DRAFT_763288 [Sparassis latifolia]